MKFKDAFIDLYRDVFWSSRSFQWELQVQNKVKDTEKIQKLMQEFPMNQVS